MGGPATGPPYTPLSPGGGCVCPVGPAGVRGLWAALPRPCRLWPRGSSDRCGGPPLRGGFFDPPAGCGRSPGGPRPRPPPPGAAGGRPRLRPRPGRPPPGSASWLVGPPGWSILAGGAVGGRGVARLGCVAGCAAPPSGFLSPRPPPPLPRLVCVPCLGSGAGRGAFGPPPSSRRRPRCGGLLPGLFRGQGPPPMGPRWTVCQIVNSSRGCAPRAAFAALCFDRGGLCPRA